MLTQRASSASNLQNDYDVSTNGLIITDATIGAVKIRRGSGADTDSVFAIQNGAGTNNFVINGNGQVTSGDWQGTVISATKGGTGQIIYDVGDILFANTTTTLSKLNAAAAGNALLSGATPTWGKIGLTTHVSGVLGVANGGTGLGTPLNNNRYVISSGGAFVETAAATNGQLLIGSTGAAPVVASVGAGDNVVITTGAGTLSINAKRGSENVRSNANARTTTTSSTFQTKTTITTGTLEIANTYRLDFCAVLDSVTANRDFGFRINNSTDATVVYLSNVNRVPVANGTKAMSGFVILTFASTAARTFQLQWASNNNSSTIGIAFASLDFYRIA